jgi:hypothetical protein
VDVNGLFWGRVTMNGLIWGRVSDALTESYDRRCVGAWAYDWCKCRILKGLWTTYIMMGAFTSLAPSYLQDV